MAYRCNTLAGIGKLANQLLYFVDSAESVWHETARKQYGIKIFRLGISDSNIGYAGVSILPRVRLLRQLTRDDELSPRLDHPKFWIPKLQVFVDVSHEGENATVNKWRIHSVCNGYRMEGMTACVDFRYDLLGNTTKLMLCNRLY
jgi:hypothetical protein